MIKSKKAIEWSIAKIIALILILLFIIYMIFFNARVADASESLVKHIFDRKY